MSNSILGANADQQRELDAIIERLESLHFRMADCNTALQNTAALLFTTAYAEQRN